MKKLFLLFAMATLFVSQSFAQQKQAQLPSDPGCLSPQDYGYFNHLSAGISLGTDGIGIELAAPITYDFAVRTGINFFPKFKYSKSLHLTDGTIDENSTFTRNDVDLEGKLNKFDFKLLVDWYPFKTSSFHATAGFYVGGGTLVDVYNTQPFINKKSTDLNPGIELGDASTGQRYTMVVDQSGNVKAELKVNSFKPYLGVGFGRAVPKGRIGVQFDLGVQFWGRPEVWGNMYYVDNKTGKDVINYEKIKKNRIISENKDYQDLKDAVKTIEKIGVYPVLNIRINGRLF